jgi:hypothetical protein
MNKETLTVKFWYDPDGELTCASLNFKEQAHQTHDIRKFHKSIVLSKSTLVESIEYPMDESYEKFGFTSREVTVEVEIQHEPSINYHYIYFDEGFNFQK